MAPITLQRLVKKLDKLKPEADAARLKSPDYGRWLARMILRLRERGLDADIGPPPQRRSRRRSSGEPSWLRWRRTYTTGLGWRDDEAPTEVWYDPPSW